MREVRSLGLYARVLAIAMLLAVSVPQAMAADDDRVERLMTAMGVDQMLVQMNQQMGVVMQQSARSAAGDKLSEAQLRIFDKYMSRMSDLFFNDANRGRFRGIIAQVYSSQFSNQEIDDMIRFYESDTGRSMVAKMPQVMQQSMQATMVWMQQMKPDMDKLTAEMQAELKQSIANQPAVQPKKSSL